MSSPEQSKSPATRSTASRGSAVTRSRTTLAYDCELKPRTTRTGIPAYASQPVSCWRRVSFSAATYSACSWPRCGPAGTSRASPPRTGRARPGGRDVDLPDRVDQVEEPALPACLRQLCGQPPAHRRGMRQRALGDQAVHHLAQRDAALVALHDLPGPDQHGLTTGSVPTGRLETVAEPCPGALRRWRGPGRPTSATARRS